jgi:hypothetical protein
MLFAVVFPLAVILGRRFPALGSAMLSIVPMSAAAPIDATGVYTSGNGTLELNLSTFISNLYDGAETMFSSLAGPYLLIAGFSFGIAILMAIVSAIKIRI